MAEYALLVVWLRRRTPRAKQCLLVGLLLLIVLPIIQAVIQTEQEKLRDTCQALVQAVQAGRVSQVSPHVSQDFAMRDIDREAFLAGVEVGLKTNAVEDAKLTIRKITLDGDGNRAEVLFKVVCRVVTPDFDQPQVSSLWMATFQKEGETWRLIAVDPKPTPVFPLTRLEQLLP